MVGSALFRKLKDDGYVNLITKTSSQLDLRNQNLVNDFFANEKPEYVFLAAAKVGGIVANNTYKADFIYQNLMIEANVIHAAYINRVKKLLFLGSSCIYPKMAPQPLKEEYLLSGYLEETNQPYAIAKIAGIEMCNAYRDQYSCNFISAMPTNLYGPNDNYDLTSSHVLPAILRKFIVAKRERKESVILWGSGKPRREFMYVDDLARASIFLMKTYNKKGHINIGTGKDISIYELAQMVSKIVGYQGRIDFDSHKPDGTPIKLLDVSLINSMGWEAEVNLEEGILKTYIEIREKIWE